MCRMALSRARRVGRSWKLRSAQLLVSAIRVFGYLEKPVSGL